MDITVVICTYNGAARLRRALESLTKVEGTAAYSWHVLVVDNNSSDHTKEVVHSFIDNSVIDLSYCFEGRQGLSFARNAGVKRALGKIVAFIDDDIVVHPDWLGHIFEAFRNQDVAVVGGAILPIWPAPRPSWLTEKLYNTLALLDHGVEDAFLDNEDLWGANLALRTNVIKTHGMFDTSLGRIGEKLFSGEETDLLRKIRTGGGKLFYCAKAKVFHYIPAERMQKRYFRRWNRDNGELAGARFSEPISKSIFGIPLYVVRMCLEAICIAAVARLTGHRDKFEKELKIYYYYGFFVGRLRHYFRWRDVPVDVEKLR